jgi:predicted ester cyclase
MTTTITHPAVAGVFEAINTRNPELVRDLVTDDFVDHGSPFPPPPGPDGYASILTFVTSTLQIRYEIEDVITTDDRVVVRGRAHGIGAAALHGPEASGKPYQMETIHIYRVHGDRLAEHWGVRDELGVLIQLGTLPPPDPALLAAAAPTAC